MGNRNLVFFLLLGVMFSPMVYAYQLGMFDIKPIASLKEKFDDNIHLSNANKKSDWITFLSLGLEAIRETRVDSLSLRGFIEQKIYAKRNDFNGLTENLELDYKRELSRFDRISLKNKFLRADEATSFQEEFGRVSGRYNYYKNLLTMGYEHDFTEQLTGKLKYNYEIYDQPSSTSSDSQLNQPGFEMAYAFSSRTIGSVIYDYSNRSFDPGGTVKIHSPALGLKQYLTNQVFVDAKVGAKLIETVDDRKTSRPSYSLGITDEFNESTHAGIGFVKTYDAHFSSSDLFNSWSIYAFWGRQLAQRFFVNLGAFTGSGKFVSGTKEKFNGFNVGLDYELTKNTKVNFEYTFASRDSSVSVSDYDKNTVSMGMTINF